MTQRIDPAVASRIRLVVFDVDGVMTDGGIYLGATGVAGSAPIELKRYDIQDGLGVLLLRQAGLLVAIITGRVSESVRLRAQELKVDELVQDKHARKLAALTRLLDARGLTPEEVAFVGDDFPDAGPMRMVGLPVAVGNAVPEIKAMAQVTLTRTGGHGAVREFAELLLSARGEWVTQWERYVADRSALDGAEPRTAGRA